MFSSNFEENSILLRKEKSRDERMNLPYHLERQRVTQQGGQHHQLKSWNQNDFFHGSHFTTFVLIRQFNCNPIEKLWTFFLQILICIRAPKWNLNQLKIQAHNSSQINFFQRLQNVLLPHRQPAIYQESSAKTNKTRPPKFKFFDKMYQWESHITYPKNRRRVSSAHSLSLYVVRKLRKTTPISSQIN